MASYKKDINLLAAMTRKTPRVHPLAFIVPVLTFLGLGLLIASSVIWVTGQTTLLTLERDELQHYMDSPRVSEGQAEAVSLQAAATEVQARAAEVKGTLYNLSSYPDLSGEEFQTIFNFAGENIQLTEFNYDRRSGTLSFSASSQSVRGIPTFIAALRESGIFADVQYKGYVNGVRIETGGPVFDPITEVTTLPNIEIYEYLYQVSCLVANPTPGLPALDEAASSDVKDATTERSAE